MLHVHPHLVGRALCTAFQDMGNTKLSRDLEKIARRVLEPLCRGMRDHLQITDLGQPRENLLLNAVRKIGVVRVPTEIFER
jgi:hypothetical protein